MRSENIHILVADDDKDDCDFFSEALKEIPLSITLTTVHDGAGLIELLTKATGQLPHVLFLDLTLPLKNGFDCLSEIKRHNKLMSLPVIIFSTSFTQEIADHLYKNGAQHYIRKPPQFSQLKKIIHQALTIIGKNNLGEATHEKFVLSV